MTRDADQEAPAPRAQVPKAKPVVGTGPRPKRSAPVAAATPTLAPLTGDYEIDAHALALRVRRSWLEQDPAARMLEMLHALQRAGQLTWATPADLQKVAAFTSRPRGDAEVIRIDVGLDVFAIVGLPPTSSAMVEPRGAGLAVLFRVDGVRDTRVRLATTDIARALSAVEVHTGLPIEAGVRDAIVRREVWADGHNGCVLIALDERALGNLFGHEAWHAWRASGTGGARARPRSVSAALTAAERARVHAWLRAQLDLGAQAVPVTRELLQLVEEIERKPLIRDRVIAQLRVMASPAGAPLDAVALRRALDEAHAQLERKRFGLAGRAPDAVERLVGHAALDQRTAVGPPGQVDVPVRIVQRGLLLAGKPARFELELAWDQLVMSPAQRRAFEQVPWHVDVEWVFERQDGWAVRPEVRRSHHEGGDIAIAHTLNLGAGERRGVWTVHAFAHSNHFRLKHLTTNVEVKTEAARLEELRSAAMGDMQAADDRAEPHRFAPRLRDRAVSSIRLPGQHDADADGTRTRGTLPAAFRTTSPVERLAQRQVEMMRLATLLPYLVRLQRDGKQDNRDAIAAVERQLQHLHETERRLATDQRDGWQPFELRGTYLSRRVEVGSGPLELYGAARRVTLMGHDAVAVSIRDLSYRLGARAFRFEGVAETFEAALEGAFVDLCKTYPEGVMAVLAQSLDAGLAPGRRTLGFELPTTSPWKRFMAKSTNPVTQVLLHAAASALMLFAPVTASVILPMLLASSTVTNVDDLITRHANGTLTTRAATLTLMQVGLDVLPFARGARALQGTSRLVAFEAASHAGMAVVMTLQARAQIAALQEAEITALEDRYRQLLELEKTRNPSDPDLARLREELERGSARIRKATAATWTQLIGEQAIFFATNHVLTSTQRGRVADAEVRVARPTRVGDAAPEAGTTDGAVRRPVPASDGPASRAAAVRDPASRPDAQPARQDSFHDVAGPGSFEVTAAAVHGSRFRGRALAHPMPDRVVAAARTSLERAVGAHAILLERVHAPAYARSQDRDLAEQTFLLRLPDASYITVRISAGPLEGQTVARTILNPTKEGLSPVVRGKQVQQEKVRGRYVIQLSDRLDGANVRRAVAHEVAELLARRELVLGDQVPPVDVLRAGAGAGGRLSPHDRGRIAELELLGRDAAARGQRGERAQRELAALIEDMGLRDGSPGARERFARIQAALGDEARGAVVAARRTEGALDPRARAHLDAVRAEADVHRAEQAELDRYRAPVFAMPTTGLGRKATLAEARALRDGARDRREAVHHQTVAKLRDEAQRGRPKRGVQVGGNAALAARDPDVLLIDANQRWAVDGSARIAQTAHQLDALRDAGFGDPYEFAAPNERVPIEAIQYW